MRTADESQSSGGGDEAAELGGGYASGVTPEDLSDGFGDTFDDDYDETSGGTIDVDETLDELGLDQDAVAGMSENQAEEVLVDIVEAEGFTTDEAEDIVDDVQSDTDMTATELLEDYVEYYDEPDNGGLGFDSLGGPDTSGSADAVEARSSAQLDLDLDG